MKGSSTVDVLQLDRREALATGYVRTYRRQIRLIAQFLQTGEPQSLPSALEEQDDHGLLGWLFAQPEQPLLHELRQAHAAIWRQCHDRFC